MKNKIFAFYYQLYIYYIINFELINLKNATFYFFKNI